jgi:PKD domain
MPRAASSIGQRSPVPSLRKPFAFAVICLAAVLSICASASAAPTWLTPTTISEAQDPFELALAVDSGGDAVTAWSDFGGGNENIEAAGTTAPGAGWNSPTKLAESSFFIFQPPMPQVAIDSHGDAVAVWEIYKNSKWYVQASQMPAGGTWQTPVQLAETNYALGQPQVAIDAQGDAVAAWTTSNGSHDLIDASELPAGGSWQTPAQISGSSEEAAQPHVAMNAAGDAVVAWTIWTGSTNTIAAAELPAGGTWQTPAQISNAGNEDYDPQVAIDEHGDVVAVWEHNNGGQEVVQAAQLPAGGSWQSTASQLSEGGQSAYNPELASNPQGDAVVVWERYNGSDQIAQAAQLPAGGSWQPAVNISESGVDGGAPHVAIDPQGDEVAVWTRWDGSTDTAEASELAAGGTWQTPVALSAGVQDSYNPRVGMSSNGEAVAVWTAYNGSGDVVQSANFVGAGPQLNEVSIPASGMAGQQLSFSVTPVDDWTPVGQTSWSFGDGATATGTSVTHEYSAPGEYEVTVESTDSLGNITTEKRKILIEAPPAPKPEEPAKEPSTEEPAKETPAPKEPAAKQESAAQPQTSTTTTPTIVSPPADPHPAPVLDLITGQEQPLINSHALSLGATCGPAACTASVSGSVKLPGHRRALRVISYTGAIPAGGFRVLRLDVPRHLRRSVRRYLVHHPRYKVTLHLTVVTMVGGHASHTESLDLPIWTYPGFR